MTESGKKGFNVGIVGATGAVGVEIIKCLSKREFPVQRLTLYTSARSSGKIASTEYGDIILEEYNLAEVRQCDIVFLAVSGEFALENAKLICADGGPIVIDNSSAFRYDADIPLVVSVPTCACDTLR
jgi:aspartate-semialdehyde dehydrogenase